LSEYSIGRISSPSRVLVTSARSKKATWAVVLRSRMSTMFCPAPLVERVAVTASGTRAM